MVIINVRRVKRIDIVPRHRQQGVNPAAPVISVVMSVYNSAPYLAEAINSILAQTRSDFELIIIYNPSTDSSIKIINSFKDMRIKVLYNSSPQNLAMSLNRGIRQARGKYIARMDADDISVPHRLEKMVAFLDKNREVGICGSWIKTMGGNEEIIKLPTTPGKIKSTLLFQCPLAHPTVVMRKDVLLKHHLLYNPLFPAAEDYELWSRASQCFPLHNLDEVLLLYRLHFGQASRTGINETRKYAAMVRKQELLKMGIDPDFEELQLHQSICTLDFTPSREFVEKARPWFNRLGYANIISDYCPEPEFGEILQEQWGLLCSICGVQSQSY